MLCVPIKGEEQCKEEEHHEKADQREKRYASELLRDDVEGVQLLRHDGDHAAERTHKKQQGGAEERAFVLRLFLFIVGEEEQREYHQQRAECLNDRHRFALIEKGRKEEGEDHRADRANTLKEREGNSLRGHDPGEKIERRSDTCGDGDQDTEKGGHATVRYDIDRKADGKAERRANQIDANTVVRSRGDSATSFHGVLLRARADLRKQKRTVQ